jgi:hypothetical protein
MPKSKPAGVKPVTIYFTVPAVIAAVREHLNDLREVLVDPESADRKADLQDEIEGNEWALMELYRQDADDYVQFDVMFQRPGDGTGAAPIIPEGAMVS